MPDRPPLVVGMGQIGEKRRHRLPGVVRHDPNFGLMDAFGIGIRFDDDSELSRRERDRRANRIDSHAVDERFDEKGVVALTGEAVHEGNRLVGKILALIDPFRRHRVEGVHDRGNPSVETLRRPNTKPGIAGAIEAEVMLECGEDAVHRCSIALDQRKESSRGEHRVIPHYRPLFFREIGVFVQNVEGNVELSHVVI